MRMAIVWGVLFASVGIVSAQHSQPYQGLEKRDIKALSEQQVADVKAGKGMTLALAAELNGYPGPSHVLELANQLQLSAEQKIDVGILFEAMKAESIQVGEHLLAEERKLDRHFSSQTITTDSLADQTRDIGGIQAELRNAHLKYHLLTKRILTAEQIKRYGELRGYVGAGHSDVHKHQ